MVIHSDVESQYVPYVKEFERHYGSTVDIAGIGTSKLEGTKIGICWFMFRSITIDPIYWSRATHLMRESLIFHELGHCSLYRFHDNRVMSDFCPFSLMHEYAIPQTCYRRHRQHYINQLFGEL